MGDYDYDYDYDYETDTDNDDDDAMPHSTAPLARPLRAAAAGALAFFCVCAASFVSAQSVDGPATVAMAPAASAPAVDDTLFRALGGQAGIDRIVNDFVARLPTDPRLGEFFKNSNLVHLRQMLSLQFCALSGGTCTYTGLSMQQAHQNMDISKADFNALVETLQSAMDAQGVAFATQNQLLARLAPMHRDVINVH